MEKSFNDETDSDDEDFVVGSRDEETFNQPFNDETDSEEESMVADRQPEDGDDDTYLSDDRTSGLGEENELHNDSKATISPEKVEIEFCDCISLRYSFHLDFYFSESRKC